MAAATIPLTLTTAWSSWRWDLPTSALVVGIGVALIWAIRRSSVRNARVVPVVAGCAVWLVSACSFIGVYSDTLFWVRALQFVLLLMVVPFCVALSAPVTALGDVVGPQAGQKALRSPTMRVITSPAMTSAAMIVTPWLIYLTGWYPALLRSAPLDAATRLLLVVCGFGYFYARLQLDPTPRRYPQGLSLLITIAETLADGTLGVVMWQGGLIAEAHYAALQRTWGPSLRTDQTIGAGVFWILGDVVGLPFLMVLFGRFRSEERLVERAADAQLSDDDDAVAPGLWWESDPELRERFR